MLGKLKERQVQGRRSRDLISCCLLWHFYELFKKHGAGIWIWRSVAKNRSLGRKQVFVRFSSDRALVEEI